jgi:hypothetical protein
MHMLPRDHPSGRHSQVDWSKPNYEEYPNFKKVGFTIISTYTFDRFYMRAHAHTHAHAHAHT